MHGLCVCQRLPAYVHASVRSSMCVRACVCVNVMCLDRISHGSLNRWILNKGSYHWGVYSSGRTTYTEVCNPHVVPH